MRTNPGDATGKWTGLNSSTLALREIYGIAYDGISNRLTVASQDTGTATQTTPRSAGYTAIGQGDGFNAIVERDEDVQAAWSEVENQCRRRADLVPNVVAAVKGAAAFEQQALSAVVDARAERGWQYELAGIVVTMLGIATCLVGGGLVAGGMAGTSSSSSAKPRTR